MGSKPFAISLKNGDYTSDIKKDSLSVENDTEAVELILTQGIFCDWNILMLSQCDIFVSCKSVSHIVITHFSVGTEADFLGCDIKHGPVY